MERSEQTNELAAALAKAQGQIAAAVKDKTNPRFRSFYADLASVWNACRGPLSANGLAVSQLPESSDGKAVTVETVLMHQSGQWIKSSLTLKPTVEDAQGIGSAITYALAAIVGVCADEDDDGNAASSRPAAKDKASVEPDEQALIAASEAALAKLLTEIERAASKDHLDAIAKQVKAAKLTTVDTESVRRAWHARAKQLEHTSHAAKGA